MCTRLYGGLSASHWRGHHRTQGLFVCDSGNWTKWRAYFVDVYVRPSSFCISSNYNPLCLFYWARQTLFSYLLFLLWRTCYLWCSLVYHHCDLPDVIHLSPSHSSLTLPLQEKCKATSSSGAHQTVSEQGHKNGSQLWLTMLNNSTS